MFCDFKVEEAEGPIIYHQDVNIVLCYGLSIEAQIPGNQSPRIYFKLPRDHKDPKK